MASSGRMSSATAGGRLSNHSERIACSSSVNRSPAVLRNLDIEKPSVGLTEEGCAHATRFVAEVAASPCGNHLAREGRLARASALLLMQNQIWQSRPTKSSAISRYRLG